jgi:hypothetical protein
LPVPPRNEWIAMTLDIVPLLCLRVVTPT